MYFGVPSASTRNQISISRQDSECPIRYTGDWRYDFIIQEIHQIKDTEVKKKPPWWFSRMFLVCSVSISGFQEIKQSWLFLFILLIYPLSTVQYSNNNTSRSISISSSSDDDDELMNWSVRSGFPSPSRVLLFSTESIMGIAWHYRATASYKNRYRWVHPLAESRSVDHDGFFWKVRSTCTETECISR